jgi:hypothetical protein
MNNLLNYAKNELDLHALLVPDSVITPFKKEILALCETFGDSGQSGGSAPFVVSALTKTINNLLSYKPLNPITGNNEEWNDISGHNNEEPLFQNKRCSALFKNNNNDKSYYQNAIVWKGESDYDTFTGGVYIDDKEWKFIHSKQYVKFPFTPKTFYIDVIRVPIEEKEAVDKNISYIKDEFDNCYYTIVKDIEQLKEIFEYYEN